MIGHGALSVVVDLQADKEQYLIDLFKQMESVDVDTNDLVPFKKIESIHFARFVVLSPGEDSMGVKYPAKLAFTTNYDLPLDNHLNELADKAGPGLWQIFSTTIGFPSGDYNRNTLIAFLNTAKMKTNTFYVGIGIRSVSQIRDENRLREMIEAYADEKKAEFDGKPAVEIRNQIVEYAKGQPGMEWLKTPAPQKPFSQTLNDWGKLILVIVILVLFSPIIVPFVIIWWLLILIQEITGKDVECHTSKDHLRELIYRETGPVQTQFSAYGEVKPGKMRLLTMLFLLNMTDFLAPFLFNKGKLNGIPTVHFARWLILNKGRQMLFLSNFDGSSEGYLRDFINIAAMPLTLMFTHTIGYPKTRLMLFGGAKDAKGFMEWARKQQVITNIWYSANRSVTVNNIYNNSVIRAGFYGEMTEKEATDWLKKI